MGLIDRHMPQVAPPHEPPSGWSGQCRHSPCHQESGSPASAGKQRVGNPFGHRLPRRKGRGDSGPEVSVPGIDKPGPLRSRSNRRIAAQLPFLGWNVHDPGLQAVLDDLPGESPWSVYQGEVVQWRAGMESLGQHFRNDRLGSSDDGLMRSICVVVGLVVDHET